MSQTMVGRAGTRLALFVAAALVAGCSGEMRVIDSFTDTLDAAGVGTLDASVETGALTVIGDTSADHLDVRVDVTTDKTATGKDDDALHAAHLEFRETTGGTALLSVWFDPQVAGYATDVVVSVPAGLAVIGAADEGRVSLSDVGVVALDVGAGDVEVLGATGTVEVIDKAGDVFVDGVVGTVTVDDGAGDLEVANVVGDVVIDDGAGDIRVAHVTGHVTIRDSGGEIDIDDVGSVSIE